MLLQLFGVSEMCGSRAKFKTAEEVSSKGGSTGVDESQSTGLITVSVEHVHGSLASLVIILVVLAVAWLVWWYLRRRVASPSPPTPSAPAASLESVRADSGNSNGRVLMHPLPPSVSYRVDSEMGVAPSRPPSIQWTPSWQPASFAE